MRQSAACEMLMLIRIGTEKFMLMNAGRVTPQVAAQMRGWRHTGFSVHKDVYLPPGDARGIENLAKYITRCPFSQARMRVTSPEGGEGRVLYMAGHGACRAFPKWREASLRAGAPRNFEIYKPLDFLALVTQHIPDKSQHLVRYYGFYSNRSRGKRKAVAEAGHRAQPECPAPLLAAPEDAETAEFRKHARRRWAALIKKVYEVDPLVCPKCGGEMKIIAFVTDGKAIRKILVHLGGYSPHKRGPPTSPPQDRAGPTSPPPGLGSLPWEKAAEEYPDPDWAE